MKLQIISKNSWLEILLKQYFSDIEITTEDIADVIVVDQENSISIALKKTQQSWQLVKPMAILALINIIEQTKQLLSENIINIGPIQFYPDNRFCIFHDEEISLTQKETEILLYLAKHHPQEIDKATLLNAIWGYSGDISTHTLETHIYKLRSKFAGKYELIISNGAYYSLQ